MSVFNRCQPMPCRNFLYRNLNNIEGEEETPPARRESPTGALEHWLSWGLEDTFLLQRSGNECFQPVPTNALS